MFAQWEPFGPEGIAANRLRFLLDNDNHWGICHDQGIFLYDQVSHVWTDYPADLPVIDAYYLNGEEILVILGCGSNSDGIYAFDPDNGEFTLIDWSDCPNFIAYDEILQRYYIGSHLGLWSSANGTDWNEIAIFNNMNIVDMAIYQNHIAVSQMDNLYSIWYSDDHGTSWTQSPAGSPMISDLGFDNYGMLYGIFPDMSYSSGLWSSQDWGETWDVEFWSVEMSCVGFDAMGYVFTGWGENAVGTEQGIARYDPVSGELLFINEGLTSLIINEIRINPMMSAIALFCCTEDGAYISFDYVGTTERSHFSPSACLEISPNPASGFIKIANHLPENEATILLYVCDLYGKKVMELKMEKGQGSLMADISGLPAGVYLMVMDTAEVRYCRKIVVE
jgi:hypothetical protein